MARIGAGPHPRTQLTNNGWNEIPSTYPAFERFLIEHRVNELYLAGVDAEFCVLLTARGAVNRGYRVHLVKDAVGLMKEDKWADVLADYSKAGVHIMSVAEF